MAHRLPATHSTGRLRATCAAALALWIPAGCGGGGGGAAGPGAPPDFGEYEATSNALHAQWDAVGATAPASLPYSGSASYDGVLRLRAEVAAGERKMDGRLVLNVDFATATLSGSASGFVDQAGVRLSGTLAVQHGVIDRAANLGVDYTYSSVLSGSISGPADSFAINADMSGDFIGPAHGATGGVVAGTASSGFGNGYLFGDFIAAR